MSTILEDFYHQLRIDKHKDMLYLYDRDTLHHESTNSKEIKKLFNRFVDLRNENNIIPNQPMLICGYCHWVKEDGSRPVSHGICDKCYKKEMKELK